ncbi:sialoadhesin [Oreochromis niloticus]|uniref:sialoadhesin n=1 Tax=Oreochromis niloticus TaxID=8128 RepID=UPI000DF3EA41|nr:sialoadhesin [Oreochromis niloticus]
MLNVKVWTTTIMPFRNACRLFVGVIIYISGVNGGETRICALKGSSVDLHCSHQHLTSSTKWFTIQWKGNYVQSELSVDGQRVTYNMSEEKNNTLTINDLRESDANSYCCMKTTDSPQLCWLNRISLQVVAELQVKVIPATEGQTVTLMCSSSCPLTEKPAAYIWYKNREFLYEDWSPWYQELLSSEEAVTYSCAVKGYEDLRAPEVSVGVQDKNCWRVNYVSRRICALEGSSVNITSEYSHPDNMKPEFKCWSKKLRSGDEEVKRLTEAAGRVEYKDNMKNQHMLTINNLKKNDSGGYTFKYKRDHEGWTQSDLPGVFLIVTELRVKMTPSAVVTEGQRVTLTCSTSCPLTDNTNYIWYLNSRPLTPRENQNKHLILDPVIREDAGSYSCAVKTNKDISSAPKTLTVQSITGTWTPAAAGVSAALLVLILLTVCWCRRKKRTSSQSPRRETSDNKQMHPGPICENISAHYSRMQVNIKHQQDFYYEEADLHASEADLYANAAELYAKEAELDEIETNIYCSIESL